MHIDEIISRNLAREALELYEERVIALHRARQHRNAKQREVAVDAALRSYKISREAIEAVVLTGLGVKA